MAEKRIPKGAYFTFVTQHPEKAPKGLRDANNETWIETGKNGEHRGEISYYLKNTNTGEVREWPLSDMARMRQTVLSYDQYIGKLKQKENSEKKLLEAIFGGSSPTNKPKAPKMIPHNVRITPRMKGRL